MQTLAEYNQRKITVDDSLAGRRARVVRTVTAVKATAEWTGCRIWDGVITHSGIRDAATGEVRGVCVRTDREHTWLAVGEWCDYSREWRTTIELAS